MRRPPAVVGRPPHPTDRSIGYTRRALVTSYAETEREGHALANEASPIPAYIYAYVRPDFVHPQGDERASSTVHFSTQAGAIYIYSFNLLYARGYYRIELRWLGLGLAGDRV